MTSNSEERDRVAGASDHSKAVQPWQAEGELASAIWDRYSSPLGGKETNRALAPDHRSGWASKAHLPLLTQVQRRWMFGNAYMPFHPATLPYVQWQGHGSEALSASPVVPVLRAGTSVAPTASRSMQDAGGMTAQRHVMPSSAARRVHTGVATPAPSGSMAAERPVRTMQTPHMTRVRLRRSSAMPAGGAVMQSGYSNAQSSVQASFRSEVDTARKTTDEAGGTESGELGRQPRSSSRSQTGYRTAAGSGSLGATILQRYFSDASIGGLTDLGRVTGGGTAIRLGNSHNKELTSRSSAHRSHVSPQFKQLPGRVVDREFTGRRHSDEQGETGGGRTTTGNEDESRNSAADELSALETRRDSEPTAGSPVAMRSLHAAANPVSSSAAEKRSGLGQSIVDRHTSGPVERATQASELTSATTAAGSKRVQTMAQRTKVQASRATSTSQGHERTIRPAGQTSSKQSSIASGSESHVPEVQRQPIVPVVERVSIEEPGGETTEPTVVKTPSPPAGGGAETGKPVGTAFPMASKKLDRDAAGEAGNLGEQILQRHLQGTTGQVWHQHTVRKTEANSSSRIWAQRFDLSPTSYQHRSNFEGASSGSDPVPIRTSGRITESLSSSPGSIGQLPVTRSAPGAAGKTVALFRSDSIGGALDGTKAADVQGSTVARNRYEAEQPLTSVRGRVSSVVQPARKTLAQSARSGRIDRPMTMATSSRFIQRTRRDESTLPPGWSNRFPDETNAPVPGTGGLRVTGETPVQLANFGTVIVQRYAQQNVLQAMQKSASQLQQHHDKSFSALPGRRFAAHDFGLVQARRAEHEMPVMAVSDLMSPGIEGASTSSRAVGSDPALDGNRRHSGISASSPPAISVRESLSGFDSALPDMPLLRLPQFEHMDENGQRDSAGVSSAVDVQRMPSGEALVSPSASTPGDEGTTTANQSAPPGTTAIDPIQGQELNLERIADEVYMIIERRLIFERESLGLSTSQSSR